MQLGEVARQVGINRRPSATTVTWSGVLKSLPARPTASAPCALSVKFVGFRIWRSGFHWPRSQPATPF